MQFKSIHLKNFLSYQDQIFENIGDKGLVLIEGRNLDEGDSNGSGKSSIWDGISWCLFGQTVRGLKNDEVINRKFGSNCHVKIEVGTGERTIISRFRSHDSFGNRLIVETGGKTVELGTIAQTQDWLLKFLGIDFELFRCTVLFAQGETFNFVNAGNKQQKDILSKVMRVNFDDYLLKVKAKSKVLESESSDIERKIDVLKSHVVDNPASLFKEEFEEWEANRRTKFERMKAESLELALQRGDAKPLDKYTLMQAKLKAKKIEVRKKLEDSEDSKIASELLFWRRDLNSAQSLDSVCTTCNQPVDKAGLVDRIRKSKASVVSFEKKLEEAKDKKIAINDEIAEIELNQSKLERFIGEQHRISDRNQQIDDRIERLQREMTELETQRNPFEQKRIEALLRQKDIKAKLKLMGERFGVIKEQWPYVSFWEQAFGDSGIKSFVFDLICSTLTNKANHYLNILTSGSVTISFDTQKKLKTGELREKFDCEIISEGKRVDYASYSGGEKRRISLAVDLSLSDLMADYYTEKFNIIVFDEQDFYMDDSGRLAFLKLLKEIAKTKRVFVVAHDAAFKSMFDETIMIVKDGGISRVS